MSISRQGENICKLHIWKKKREITGVYEEYLNLNSLKKPESVTQWADETFAEGDTQIANWHMKKSTLWNTREMKIKTTVRYHYITMMIVIKTKIVAGRDQDDGVGGNWAHLPMNI